MASRERARILAVVAAAAVAGVLAVVAVVLVGSGSSSDPPNVAVDFEGDFRVGGRLEHLALPAIEGEGTVDYSTFRGRPMVLNFFASWCAFCEAEMLAFEAVSRDLRGDVAFLGVAQSDTREASLQMVRRTGVRYPTALDAEGAFFRAVGSRGMPTTLFIGPDGTIRFVQAGPIDEGGLRVLIETYLGRAPG